MTTHKGIDYSLGIDSTNRDLKTGIRYGVIPMHEVTQAWCDESTPYYGEEEVEEEDFDFAEPISFYIENGEYSAECGDSGDIFIMKSPYFTYAQFCSPCAPGACYLTNALDTPDENNRAYCFGADWFEGDVPYPIYSMKTGKLVK